MVNKLELVKATRDALASELENSGDTLINNELIKYYDDYINELQKLAKSNSK